MFIKSKLLLLLLLATFYSEAQITITIRKSFIDSFKSRLTIAANYEIWYAHKSPNPASKDGDLHFAGWDKKIGLPIVAEIMNAKDEHDAVALVHEKEGKGEPSEKVKLTGVWRLWCEHPGDIFEFKQGRDDIPIENTNPPHVFEIHPATKLGDIDLLPSLKEINGFAYKDAEDAFSKYSNMRCKLSKKGKYVSIETNGIGYNYVDFWLKFNEANNLTVSDGLFAYCSIYSSKPEEDEGEELISHKLKIGFVKGSALYDKAKTMGKGGILHVVGIPRINLALVAWRIEHAAEKPEALQWNLPIEMVAVGELEE